MDFVHKNAPHFFQPCVCTVVIYFEDIIIGAMDLFDFIVC
jgi:hypothetical protein